jgi:K+-sensing histidine kinase KdpD
MISSLKTQKEELEEYNLLLIESQKELKETNKTKDKFFNIIAHDLKGPFTSFITITDILTNDPQSLSEDKRNISCKALTNLP